MKGRLSKRLASAFDGLEREAADGETVLNGPFADQRSFMASSTASRTSASQ